MKQICLQLQNVSDVQNWTEIASALNAGPLAGNPKGLLASKRRRSKTTRCSGEATLEMNTKARRLPRSCTFQKHQKMAMNTCKVRRLGQRQLHLYRVCLRHIANQVDTKLANHSLTFAAKASDFTGMSHKVYFQDCNPAKLLLPPHLPATSSSLPFHCLDPWQPRHGSKD